MSHLSQATLTLSQKTSIFRLRLLSLSCWCTFLWTSIFSSLSSSRAALLLLGWRGSAHGHLQSAPTLSDQREKQGWETFFFLRPKKAFSKLHINLLFSSNNPQGNPTNVVWSTWNEAMGYIQTHPNYKVAWHDLLGTLRNVNYHVTTADLGSK